MSFKTELMRIIFIELEVRTKEVIQNKEIKVKLSNDYFCIHLNKQIITLIKTEFYLYGLC